MLSAPARAESRTCRSGRSIIRCTSISPPASCTRSATAPTISAPKVIGGTKWPSITSTWITRAPAASTSSTCEPSREKSAERIDGATRRSSRSGFPTALHSSEHAALAVVTREYGGTRHPHDRGVLAAVGAYRDELVTLHAVEAPIAAGHGSGPQPRLATAGTLRPQLHPGFGHRAQVNGHA